MDISNSENDGLMLVFSPSRTGDKIPTQCLDLTKLNEWTYFEQGSENFSIYVNPEFQQNAALILAVCAKWITARKWLIKEEWDSKTKVHPKRKIANGLKPLGDLLISYWKLAERCHSYQSCCNTDLSSFANGAELFSKIFSEIVTIDLIHSLHPPQKIYNNNLKLGWLETEREKLRLLKDSINPFDKYIQTVGLQILINSALDLTKYSDQFVKKFWKPYLKNYGLYLKCLNSPDWGRLYAENNKWYHQSGKGKGGTGRELIGTVEAFKKSVFWKPCTTSDSAVNKNF